MTAAQANRMMTSACVAFLNIILTSPFALMTPKNYLTLDDDLRQHAQAVEPARRLAGMRLEADGDFLLAERQLPGDRVSHVEKLARLVVVERLRGDLHAVHQNVERATARVRAPVSHDQRDAPVRR